MPQHHTTLAILSLASACCLAEVAIPRPLELGPEPVLTGPPATAPAPGRATRGAPEPAFTVDLTNREAVRRFHLAIYGASEGRDMDWTGDISACLPGTTGLEFQEAVIRRVNYYRALVGVPAGVVLDSARHADVQSTAFIMSRNNIIAHDFPDDVICYTAEGDAAAGKSNLAIGATGPEAIDGYVADWGANNWAVGHRRWLIVPQQQTMATGDVPDANESTPTARANAIYVLGDNLWDPRPEVRDEFVAWPPPGYVPYPVMPVRWSFSYPEAEFESASVSVTLGGAAQPVVIEPLGYGRGENAVVWYLASLDPSQAYDWPKPAADTVYSVTVSNVLIDGIARTFSYQVKVFDPYLPGPGATMPELSGPDTLPVGSPSRYGLAALGDVTTFEWIDACSSLLTAVEGADADLGPFVAGTSAGYDPRGQKPKFQSSKCFLLTHVAPTPVDQYLTHSGTLLPGAGATLSFESRVSNATAGQVGQVQVSLDDGSSWETICSRPGWFDAENNFWGDLWFNPVTVSLDAYSGRLIRVRFVYHHVSGSNYYAWDPDINWQNGIGFYFEDVQFENVQLLTDISFHGTDAATGAVFTPPVKGSYALAARGLLFGEYPLEWGTARLVTADGEAPLSVRFEHVPSATAGMLQTTILLTPSRPAAVITVERAPSPGGPWATDAQAGVTTLQGGVRYQVSTPAGGAAGFIRVRVQ